MAHTRQYGRNYASDRQLQYWQRYCFSLHTSSTPRTVHRESVLHPTNEDSFDQTFVFGEGYNRRVGDEMRLSTLHGIPRVGILRSNVYDIYDGYRTFHRNESNALRDELQRKINELYDVNRKLLSLTDKETKARREIDELKSRAERNKIRHENRIQRLEETILKLERENAVLRGKIDLKDEKIDRLREEISVQWFNVQNMCVGNCNRQYSG